MAKPTKAQAIALHNAQMLVFACADRVFSASPRNDVPFADCLKLATPEVQEAHASARAKLQALEAELVAKGRGYRDQWGQFKAY